MVLQDCQIDFTNTTSPVFHSGDVVSGNITFTLSKEKKLSDLSFRAKGETKVSWNESTGSGKNRRTIHYHGSELHFRTVTSLVIGYPRQDGLVILPRGQHTFSFTFSLPVSIPTSLEGLYGRTRYTIKVVAIRPMRMDENFRKPLSVISKYDLNLNPKCALPHTAEINKGFNFFFSSKGALQLVLSFPYVGFVPGQHILMNCNINNPSKVSVTEMRFKLKQLKTYTATSPRTKSKYESTEIVAYAGKGAKKGENVSYPVSFVIPALPPSQHYGPLITTEYFIKVTAVVSGMHTNVKDRVPIVIGTVPLYNTHRYTSDTSLYPDTSSSPPQTEYNPSAPCSSLDSHGSGEPPPYGILAPPSYEQSQSSHAMVQGDGKSDNDYFSPVYPVYVFPPQHNANETNQKFGFNI